jgi:alkanesulfonate monooxygenase SsuD/methylene tetrahydromethanopterin reductase-like flavin-dependent oxidoreductase (luciferase family)
MKMKHVDTGMFGPNKFKLGLFGLNCAGGLAMTKAPERWDATWENNVTAVKLAEDAGLEFALPIGRWHGWKGETDAAGSSFESLVWAGGLLGLTQRITICGTLHVRFLNPIFAAKQIVTLDHIGPHRFALNIVSGWNQPEFDMFGIELLDQSILYDYTEEWVTIIKRVWSAAEPFDFEGKWFKLKDVLGKPKPKDGIFPTLISAGISPQGREFAARHVDCHFMSIWEPEKLVANIAAARSRAAQDNRALGVFASGHTICRPTRKEAQEFHHYIVHEKGDWEAAEHAAAIRSKGRETRYADVQNFKERLISGVGTYPVIGSYDDVAETFQRLSEAGIDGMALGLVNYISEFPHLRDGVLPRMERLGLRKPAAA